MASRARLGLILALIAGAAQARQPSDGIPDTIDPNVVVEACAYRGLDDAPAIIRACDQRLAAPGLTPRQRADILYQRGRQHYLGDTEKALADFNETIRLAPDFAHAYTLRGALYAKAGDLDRAIESYDRALQLKPDVFATFDRARVLSLKGAHERAMADFDAVLRIRTDDFVYMARAEAWLRAGRPDRAVADYNTVIERGAFRDLSVYAGRCWAYAAANRLDKAMADCDKAVGPFNQRAGLTSRGVVHLKAGRLDAAIADFDAALEGTAHSGRALYGRGVAHQRKGDRDAARADIAAAVAIQPDIARAMALVGVKR